MRMFVPLSIGLCFFVLAGCNSEPEETGAGAGEACDSGGQCKSDLFCFVAVDGEPGECRDIPAACGEDAKCTSGCLDDVKAECTGGHSCISAGAGNITVTCAGGS